MLVFGVSGLVLRVYQRRPHLALCVLGSVHCPNLSVDQVVGSRR